MGAQTSSLQFKEIIDEKNNIIGISTNCGKVRYNIGDKVIINDNGKKEELTIQSIDDENNVIKFDKLSIPFNEISNKIESLNSIMKGGDYILGYDGKDVIFLDDTCSYLEYRIGDIVKYKDNYNNKYTLKIIGIEKNKIILGDQTGNKLDEVPYNNLLEKKKQDTNLEIPDDYRKNSIISFEKNGKRITVKVSDFSLSYIPNTKIIDKKNSKLYYNNNNSEVNLDDSTLKKEPFGTELTNILLLKSLQKKYILENESKYRLKYAKYKTKYLIYKNNYNIE